MTLFLSLNAFNGVKKAQQKRNFIAKGEVTNNKNPMLPKPKTPFKILFLTRTKHHHQYLYFPKRVMPLHLSKLRF